MPITLCCRCNAGGKCVPITGEVLTLGTRVFSLLFLIGKEKLRRSPLLGGGVLITCWLVITRPPSTRLSPLVSAVCVSSLREGVQTVCHAFPQGILLNHLRPVFPLPRRPSTHNHPYCVTSSAHLSTRLLLAPTAASNRLQLSIIQ